MKQAINHSKDGGLLKMIRRTDPVIFAEYDGTSTATGGYTVHGFTLDNNQTLYSAAYYDSYAFIGHHGVPSSLTPSSVSGFSIDSSLGHGLQTGSATAIINGDNVSGYTYSALYYDSWWNVSQVKSTNQRGGTDVTCTSYSYTGNPMDVKVQTTTSSTSMTEIDYANTYDDADRVASRTVSVAHGNPAESATMTHEYDALGRLSSIRRQSKLSSTLDVNYDYDLHGWLKGITTNKFCEELFYADGVGTPCYNGNISSIRWKHNTSSTKRGYKFTYDNANRLTQATFGTGDAIANSQMFSESVQYDAHGNVTGITRRGMISSNSYGPMDNLTLSYDGNQLTGVSETVADHNYTGSFEYKRDKGSQYMYDNNGSLVADKSRGIAYITYDLNNQPSVIYFTNGSETRYVFSASGEKLRVAHYTAKPNITRPFGVRPADLTPSQTLYKDSTDYLLGGSLVMKNGKIDKFLFHGGYALASPTSPTADTFSFRYYNQDHLGNNREVFGMRSNTCQIADYYPFGILFSETITETHPDYQPYKYNGKELDRMHGLDNYDYGARQYNPIVARWDRMDPLCEKYYSISPYAYCAGNPVNAIDKGGKDITFLIASKGAGGYGHMGAIIGNNSTFYYITAGATNTNKGLFSNSNQEGGISIVKIEESSMSDAITFVRNNDKYNSYYDDYITFSTSKKMDDAMIKEATNKQENFKNGEEHYRLFTNNCADIVKDIFEKGTDSDLHMGISPSPNDNFANIKDKQNDIQNELNEKIHDEKRK